MFDFSKIRTALAGVGNEMSRMRKQLENLKRQREELGPRAATKADVIQLLSGHIDDEAARYAARLRAGIGAATGWGAHLRTAPNGRLDLSLLSIARGNTTSAPVLADLEALIFAAIGPSLKTMVSDLIKDMEWPEDATPLAPRPALIARLDKEIAELEAAVDALREEAAGAGVTV